MERLDEIRERWEKATEGPWTAQDYDHHPGDEGVGIIGGGEIGSMNGHLVAYALTLSDEEQCIADGDAIAHARDDVPALTAAVQGVLDLSEQWRYKGEFGWGAWQEGYGPDQEGSILDNASAQLRAAITTALDAP